VTNTTTRPNWDEYFIHIALAVSLRADCSRRKVGAVLVRDNRIVSTGYNGSPPGGLSCLAGECPRAQSNVQPGSSYDTGPGSCIAAHAEQNAIIYAGRDKCLGSTLYVTEAVCGGCARMIEASGISRIVTPLIETMLNVST
jgi:dCMP deaminase